MATRAVARRKSAATGGTDAARSVRAVGGEIADRDLVGMYLDEIARTPCSTPPRRSSCPRSSRRASMPGRYWTVCWAATPTGSRSRP